MVKNYLSLQHKFRRIFGIDDYKLASKCDSMPIYGGILYDDVELKGGLYIAIAVVLAPYYKKDIKEIEKFLKDIEDIYGIRELKLEEIPDNTFNQIMNKFEEIINKVQ
jgi:hypothetical protein